MTPGPLAGSGGRTQSANGLPHGEQDQLLSFKLVFYDPASCVYIGDARFGNKFNHTNVIQHRHHGKLAAASSSGAFGFSWTSKSLFSCFLDFLLQFTFAGEKIDMGSRN